MALEFTVAVKSLTDNLDNELETLKTAALYADKITILSPNLDVINTLNSKNKNKKNIELEIINKLIKGLPVCEFVSKEELKEEKEQLVQLEQVVKSGGYRNSSLVERMKIQNVLKESQKGSVEDLEDIFGKEVFSEIDKLGKVLKVESFKNTITKKGAYISEYLEKTDKALDKTMLLCSIESENTFMELPVFTDIEMSEVLKIRGRLQSEIDSLNKALMNFKKASESSDSPESLYSETVKESYDRLMAKFEEEGLKKDKVIKLNFMKRSELLKKIEDNVAENVAVLGNDGTTVVDEKILEDKDRTDIYFSYN